MIEQRTRVPVVGLPRCPVIREEELSTLVDLLVRLEIQIAPYRRHVGLGDIPPRAIRSGVARVELAEVWWRKEYIAVQSVAVHREWRPWAGELGVCDLLEYSN